MPVAAHGVDREVAAGRIEREIVGEADERVPPIGLDVQAQGRDLERARAKASRDGAVLQAGRHHGEAARDQTLDDLFREQGCGDVEVGRVGGGLEQRIADASADEPGAAPVGVKPVEEGLRFR